MNEFELDAIILDVLASYNGLGGTAYGDGFECMHATGTSHRHATGGHNATQTTHDSQGNPATPDPTAASTHSDSGRTDAGTATDFDGVDTGADPNASTDRDNTHGRASSGTDGGTDGRSGGGTDGRSGGGTDGSNGNGNGGGESPAVQAARERLEREEERNRELAERNIGSSSAQEALERAEENLRRTLQSDAQDQAAGRGHYSERSSRERYRDDDPGRYTDVDDGEYENEDGSATFVSTDSNGNTHVQVYSIDPQNGGEYLAETRVIRADGSVTVREHDRFGNNVVARRDYGPASTAGTSSLKAQFAADQAGLQTLRQAAYAAPTAEAVQRVTAAAESLAAKWHELGQPDVAASFAEVAEQDATTLGSSLAYSAWQSEGVQLQTQLRTEQGNRFQGDLEDLSPGERRARGLDDAGQQLITAAQDRQLEEWRSRRPDTTGLFDRATGAPLDDAAFIAGVSGYVDDLQANERRGLAPRPEIRYGMSPGEVQAKFGDAGFALAGLTPDTRPETGEVVWLDAQGNVLTAEQLDAMEDALENDNPGTRRVFNRRVLQDADGKVIGVESDASRATVGQPEDLYDPGEEADVAAATPRNAYRLGLERTVRLHGERGPEELLQALGAESAQDLRNQVRDALHRGEFERAGSLAGALTVITQGQQRRDLASYLTLRNAEDYSTAQLVEMAKAKQQVLGDLAEYQQEATRWQGLMTAADDRSADRRADRWEQEAREQGILKTFPIGGGRMVALNQLDLDTDSPEYRAAEAYAFGKVVRLDEQTWSADKVNAQQELLGLDSFTKEAKELQADIELDEKYDRDSSEPHTFETADGPVTFSAQEINTTEGNIKFHAAERWAGSGRHGRSDQESLDRLQEVLRLHQHPEALARKRKLAVLASIGLLTVPLLPGMTVAAVPGIAGISGTALAARTALAGVTLGGTISAGFTGIPAILPKGDEGWFEVTGDERRGIRDATIEGALAGLGGVGLTSGAYQFLKQIGGRVARGPTKVRVPTSGGSTRLLTLKDGEAIPAGARVESGSAVPRGQRLLSQWAPSQGVNVLSGSIVDVAASLVPDKFGKVQLTGDEWRDIGLSALIDPVVDPTLGALGRAGEYTLRTLAPRKVTLLPDSVPYGPVELEGPGGFDRLAMPAPRVPHLLGPEGPEFAEQAHGVFRTIQETGQYEGPGLVEGQVVRFEEGRMAEAFREANPGVPLWYHSSPRSDKLAPGPEVMHKEGVSGQEQYLFGAIEPVGKFQLGAAFGGAGEFPGTLVYADDGAIWGRVVDEHGVTKYYRVGYEGEGGIPEGLTIPPTAYEFGGGPSFAGDILAQGNVALPSYPARVRANLLALGDELLDRLPLVDVNRGEFVYTADTTQSSLLAAGAADSGPTAPAGGAEADASGLPVQVRERINRQIAELQGQLAAWREAGLAIPAQVRNRINRQIAALQAHLAPPSPNTAAARQQVTEDLARQRANLARLDEVGAADFVRERVSQQIDDLQVQLGEMGARVGEIPAQVRERVGDARERLAQQVDELQGQLASLRDQGLEIPAQVRERVNRQVDELQAQLASWRDTGQEIPVNVRERLSQQVADLQGQLAALRERAGEIPAQVRERVGDARERLSQQVDELQGQLSSLRDQGLEIPAQVRERVNRQVDELQAQLASWRDTGQEIPVNVRERLSQQVADLQGQVAALRERAGEIPAQVRERVDDARERLSQQVDELQGQLASLRDQGAEIPAQVRERVNRQVDELQAQLASWRDTGQEIPVNVRERLSQQIDDLQGQLAALRERAGEIPAQVRERVGDARERLAQQVEELQGQLASLRDQGLEIPAQVRERVNRQIDDLQAQLASWRDTGQEIPVNVRERLSQQVADLQGQLAALRERAGEIPAQVRERMGDARERLSQQVAELQGQLASLRDQGAEIPAQVRERVNRQVDELQAQLASWRDTGQEIPVNVRERLSQQVADLQGQLGEMGARVGEIPAQVRERVDDVRERLAQQVDELQGQLASLRDQGLEIPAQVRERVNRQVDELQAQLASWRDTGQEIPVNVRERLSQQVADLQGQLAALRERAGEIPAQVRERVGDARERLSQQVDELQGQLSSLRDQGLEIPAQVRERVSRQVDELQAQLASWREQGQEIPVNVRERLSQQIDDLQGQFAALRERAGEIPAQVRERVDDARERLSQQVDELQGQLASVPDGVLRRLIQGRIARLERQLAALEADVPRRADIEGRADDADGADEGRRADREGRVDLPDRADVPGRADPERRLEELRYEAQRAEGVRPENLRFEGLRPDDARPEDVRAEDVRPEDVRPEDVRPEDVRPEDVRPEDVRPEDVRPEDVRPEDVRPEDVRPEDVRPEDVRPEDVRPEDVRPEDVRPEDVRPEDVRPEDVRPEDVRPEDMRPEDVRPVNPRPVNPRPPGDSTTDRRRRRDEDPEEITPEEEGAKLSDVHPRKAVFTTQERVEVDLLTGEETRQPVGNLPAETLAVTEWQATPLPDQSFAGRVVDVKTDGAGRPVVEQRDVAKVTRAQGEGNSGEWPAERPAHYGEAKPWPPQTVTQVALASSLIRQQTAAKAAGPKERKKIGLGGGGQVRPAGRGQQPGGAAMMERVGKRRHGWL